jgi:hypothetical protein
MSRLAEISERLHEITTALAGEELDEDRAAELAREAAELSSEANREVDRALDEAPADE